MALYIANGTSIPDHQFSCPSNTSGVDYPSIPWDNITETVFGISQSALESGHYAGFAGIKGPHPRMAYCCQNGTDQPYGYPDRQIALAGDSCTQYCMYSGSFDLWLWCLTREGDLVQNALSGGPTKEVLMTSGSWPRDGPFNMDDFDIVWYKKHRNSASAMKKSPALVSVALGLLIIAAWHGGSF